MKKIYKDILKELNKGNAVLIDVAYKNRGFPGQDRVRLVYGKTSKFDWLNGGIDDGRFEDSCFCLKHIENNRWEWAKDSQELIENMESYDSENYLKIKQFVVLK